MLSVTCLHAGERGLAGIGTLATPRGARRAADSYHQLAASDACARPFAPKELFFTSLHTFLCFIQVPRSYLYMRKITYYILREMFHFHYILHVTIGRVKFVKKQMSDILYRSLYIKNLEIFLFISVREITCNQQLASCRFEVLEAGGVK